MKKILVVDDEPNIVELLRIELSENGYDVITASGGVQCLEKIRGENPDLVILDVRMPDLSGSQVAQTLKSDPKYKTLPLIFLTGLLSKDDEKKTGNEIASQVIFAKPFSLLKLSEKVRELLRERGKFPGRAEGTKNPPAS
jgi:DNA-binding response OmpR family regulator